MKSFSLFIFIFFSLNVSSQTFLYWGEASQTSIYRVDISFPLEIDTVISNQSTPRGIYVDRNKNQLYFASGLGRYIKNLDLNTSQLDSIIFTPNPLGVYLDEESETLFFGDGSNFTLNSVNIDGTDFRVIASNTQFPASIFYNPQDNKVYWNDKVANAIYRVNADGSDQEMIFEGVSVFNIRVDTLNNFIFFVDLDQDVISRIDLDGNNLIELFSTTDDVNQLAIDPQDEVIYWGDNSNNQIIRTPYDGSNSEVFISDRTKTVPANNVLTFSKVNFSKIEIFDLTGKMLLRNIGTKTVDISHLSNGIYLVKLSDESGKVLGVKTIVKN